MSENITKSMNGETNNPEPDPKESEAGLDSKSEAEESKLEPDPKGEGGSGADSKSEPEGQKPKFEGETNNDKECEPDQDFVTATDLKNSEESIKCNMADDRERLEKEIEDLKEKNQKELEELKAKISDGKNYLEERITKENNKVREDAIRHVGKMAREWVSFDEIVHKTGQLQTNLHDCKKAKEKHLKQLEKQQFELNELQSENTKFQNAINKYKDNIKNLESKLEELQTEMLQGADKYALSVWPVELRDCIADERVVSEMTKWFENDKIPKEDLNLLVRWVYTCATKDMDKSDLHYFSKAACAIFNKCLTEMGEMELNLIQDGFAKWMGKGNYDVCAPSVYQEIDTKQHKVQNGNGKKIRRVHSYIIIKDGIIEEKALVEV